MSPGSAYDDLPSPDFPTSPRTNLPQVLALSLRSGRTSEDRGQDSGYSSFSRRQSDDRDQWRSSEDEYSGRKSDDRRRPGEDEYNGRRSEDAYGGTGRASENNGYGVSQDTGGRKSDERDRDDFVRRPSASASTTSDSTSTTNPQSATATSGMIIPNKSTIAEEEIEVPYGRDLRESSSTAIDDREVHEKSPGLDHGGIADGEPRTERPECGTEEDEDKSALSGGGERSGEDYYDKISYRRASVASDRSNGAAGGSRTGGRASVASDEQEKLRREYEFKIATMQSRITGLERDLGDVEERERKWVDGEERVRQMEEELAVLRTVSGRQILCLCYIHLTCSGLRSRAIRCALYKKSWRNYARPARGTEIVSLVGLKRTRRSWKFSENAVNAWRRNESILKDGCVCLFSACILLIAIL